MALARECWRAAVGGVDTLLEGKGREARLSLEVDPSVSGRVPGVLSVRGRLLLLQSLLQLLLRLQMDARCSK